MVVDRGTVHAQLLCMFRGIAMLSLCFGQDLEQ